MKKNVKKSETSNLPKKTNKSGTSKAAQDLDDSFDDVFRFDDKLIGKRTNTVFEPKPVEDGIYDMIINDDLNSKYSFQTESEIISAKDSFQNVYQMDQVEDEKNEKMIRFVKKLQQESSDPILSQIYETDDAYEDNSSSQKVQEIGPKITSEKFLSAKISNDKKQDKKLQPPDISTIQKKNPIPNSQQDLLNVDKQKSTKSRPGNSQGKKNQGTQKVLTNNSQDAKVNPPPLQSKSQTKQNQEKYKKDKRNSRHPSSHEGKNIFKNQKRSNEKRKKSQSSLVRQVVQQRKEQQKKNPPLKLHPTSKEIKIIRKRAPKQAEEDRNAEDWVPKKFTVALEIQKPAKGEEYEPFGRMAEGQYPKRLRIPPLRYWHNERKGYNRGMLSSVTLIDDERGRFVSDVIESQIDQIEI